MSASMTPSYFQGLAKHLLEQADNPNVTGVQTYAEAGVEGPAWTPNGLRVVTSDGQAVFLSIVRGSAPLGDAKDMPLEYAPEP